MVRADGLPAWKPMTRLDQGETRGRLLAALFTTYDPPDQDVLVENYLPAWLDLENGFDADGTDRLRYFVELEDALRRLKGKISIVSSAGGNEPSAHAWIWNYIRRFEVGATGSAVQHAKLWMFHRVPAAEGKPETVEIVISSANLTKPGLSGQIQAGWRCVLPLEARSSIARRDGWGILTPFLTELGKASGASGSDLVSAWTELLGRCECPDGIAFIASVPGTHSSQELARSKTAWGVAGLRKALQGHARPRLLAMTPTVGEWTAPSIAKWARAAGLAPDRISIAWLRQDHPWANKWQLDPSSEAALTASGVNWLEFPNPVSGNGDWKSPFCNDHRESDTRWSHAKLYELRSGNRTRLLVTSANLSRAAWGDPHKDGTLGIANFELGVLLHSSYRLQSSLGGADYIRATGNIEHIEPTACSIAWAAAEWDGSAIKVECRTAGATLEAYIEVAVARDAKASRAAAKWVDGDRSMATVKWPAGQAVPLVVTVLASDGAKRSVAVNDVRRDEEVEFLCREYDEKARDLLLEEKYGYLPPDGADGTGADSPNRQAGTAGGADYSVPAYVDARLRFRLVDNWWKTFTDADEKSRRLVLDDGMRILGRWTEFMTTASDKALAGAARVAADELRLRLEIGRRAQS